MNENDNSVRGSDRPQCPVCGSNSVRFGYDEETDWMDCEDCNERQEWRSPKIPKGANGPGTYQWQAKRRRL